MSKSNAVVGVMLAIVFALAIILASRPTEADARPIVDQATAYCLNGRMADGTITRQRSAAHNGLRLGTKIRLLGRPFAGGLRRFVVRDRIGSGTSLDLWTESCSTARSWGRRTVRYKLGWSKPKAHTSRVYPLRQVVLRSERDAKAACQDAELFWKHVLRCEGWDGTGCHRWGLYEPFVNHFSCYQYYFMSSRAKQHVDCNRVAHYQAPNGYSLYQRVRGTSKWHCVAKPGPTHFPS